MVAASCRFNTVPLRPGSTGWFRYASAYSTPNRKTGIPLPCTTSLQPGGDVFDSRSVHIVRVATKVNSQNWLKVTLRCCLRPRVQKVQFLEFSETFACLVD